MKKSCKIAITWDCNLDCSYCCNKLDAVQNKFQNSTLDEILVQNYENISITGGEIGICPEKLNNYLEILGKTKSKLWLYTNGRLMPQMLIRPERINGINISCHNSISHSLLCVNQWEKYKDINIRLHIQDEKYDDYLISMQKLIELYIPKQNIKLWTLDKCFDNIEEDWYYISGVN
ncbi:MAG TPA: radical SAM protein [Patescibacteria group bacterium]|nr:MAG: hypothetical protein UR43_C0005G0126 [candidate division TM6 bacterium GW2011_GWF2_33_332]HLD91225.1 radical SAM protein [Patescibacteria group bacterium]